MPKHKIVSHFPPTKKKKRGNTCWLALFDLGQLYLPDGWYFKRSVKCARFLQICAFSLRFPLSDWLSDKETKKVQGSIGPFQSNRINSITHRAYALLPDHLAGNFHWIEWLSCIYMLLDRSSYTFWLTFAPTWKTNNKKAKKAIIKSRGVNKSATRITNTIFGTVLICWANINNT